MTTKEQIGNFNEEIDRLIVRKRSIPTYPFTDGYKNRREGFIDGLLAAKSIMARVRK